MNSWISRPPATHPLVRELAGTQAWFAIDAPELALEIVMAAYDAITDPDGEPCTWDEYAPDLDVSSVPADVAQACADLGTLIGQAGIPAFVAGTPFASGPVVHYDGNSIELNLCDGDFEADSRAAEAIITGFEALGFTVRRS